MASSGILIHLLAAWPPGSAMTTTFPATPGPFMSLCTRMCALSAMLCHMCPTSCPVLDVVVARCCCYPARSRPLFLSLYFSVAKRRRLSSARSSHLASLCALTASAHAVRHGPRPGSSYFPVRRGRPSSRRATTCPSRAHRSHAGSVAPPRSNRCGSARVTLAYSLRARPCWCRPSPTPVCPVAPLLPLAWPASLHPSCPPPWLVQAGCWGPARVLPRLA